MIVPNLLVADMDRAIAFYRDLLGMEVTMSVDGDQGDSEGELRPGSVFAGLQWQGAQLMLQTRDSLREELTEVEVGARGASGGRSSSAATTRRRSPRRRRRRRWSAGPR